MIRSGFVFSWLIFLTVSLFATPSLRYEVSFPKPQTHYISVQLQVTDWKDGTAEVSLAAWTPGSYLIREFAQNVEQVTAVDGTGNMLPIRKVDKDTWEVQVGRNGSFTIAYQVYAFEYSVRNSFVDADHAMINPASVFMYLEEYPQLGSTIQIKPIPTWKNITTALARNGNDTKEFVTHSFDELADSPIEIGNQEELTFEAEGVTHRVALIGDSDFDHERFTSDLKKMVETATAVFGSHPCAGKEYIFFIHFTDRGGGGLEHKFGTSVMFPARRFRSDGGYRSILGLLTHEYFHLWNGKRLRPKVLGPFDYAHENYTTLLWEVEGFTDYYDQIILKRMGVIDATEYLNRLINSINSISNTPGNEIQPVAESSWDAWIKYYRQNENSSNSIISYYSKGAAIAGCLDLLINHHSSGAFGLDTVMQTMYNRFYIEQNRGYTEEELQDILEQFTGVPMDTFFQQHIYGTEPIDYGYYLGLAGLKLIDGMPSNVPWLGVAVREDGGKMIIGQVVRGSSGWEAGLNVNDEILAIGNERANERNLTHIDEQYKVGDTVSIMVSRDGFIRTIDTKILADPRVNYIITSKAAPTKKEKRVFEGWLGTSFGM